MIFRYSLPLHPDVAREIREDWEARQRFIALVEREVTQAIDRLIRAEVCPVKRTRRRP